MLGWVLSGLISAATIATVAVVVIKIAGIISKKIIKKKLSKKLGPILVNIVDNTSNIVKVTALDDETEYELQGDGVAKDIRSGIIIC